MELMNDTSPSRKFLFIKTALSTRSALTAKEMKHSSSSQAVGDADGVAEGDREGLRLGDALGLREGSLLGEAEGRRVGELEGEALGSFDGEADGRRVGGLGREDGCEVGDADGLLEGSALGSLDGEEDGAGGMESAGGREGGPTLIGDFVGTELGFVEGAPDGSSPPLPEKVGLSVGLAVGTTPGSLVGSGRVGSAGVGAPAGAKYARLMTLGGSVQSGKADPFP